MTITKPILFEPCNGKIVYKDGTTEPIIACREFANECEVRTPSSQYIYVPYVIDTPSGYQICDYCFARFDFERREYFEIGTIKEFQFYEENKNEKR